MGLEYCLNFVTKNQSHEKLSFTQTSEPSERCTKTGNKISGRCQLYCFPSRRWKISCDVVLIKKLPKLPQLSVC